MARIPPTRGELESGARWPEGCMEYMVRQISGLGGAEQILRKLGGGNPGNTVYLRRVTAHNAPGGIRAGDNKP